MAKREHIPKSVRFEVLKRDSFTCQYCGAAAPNVLLQIDHIKPVAAGGVSELTNLITSCQPCNSGKSDRLLSDTSAISKAKAQLDELQERREQIELMMQWQEGLRDLKSETVERIADYWNSAVPGYHVNENGRATIRKWITSYRVDEITEAMSVSSDKYLVREDGKITSESVEEAFGKVIAICNVNRSSQSDPELKQAYYLRGIVRNRLEDRYYDPSRALDWIRAAMSWGVTQESLATNLKQVRSWTNFSNIIDRLIEEAKVERGIRENGNN